MLSIFARVAGAFVERSVARSTNEVIIEPHNARNQAEKSRIGKKCLENRQNVLIFELMAVPLQDSINMINICKVSWPSTCQYIVNICSRSEQYSISIYRHFLSFFTRSLLPQVRSQLSRHSLACTAPAHSTCHACPHPAHTHGSMLRAR